jgi:ribosomal protein S9
MATGQAMTKVESQMEVIKSYADDSLNAARDALSSLGALEFIETHPTTYGQWDLDEFTPEAVSVPDLVVDNSGMPTITDITIPDPVAKPDIETPTLDALLAITLPDVPTVSFPSISLSPPSYTIPTPVAWDFTISDILIMDEPFIQATIDRLTDNIKNGGTGLSETVETAIFQRDLERNEQQLEDSTDKVLAMWAKTGFSLPDGLLADSLSDLQKEYMNKSLDRSREISIKQAELEQTNLFKSMEISVALFDKLVDLLIRYEDLAVRVQEYTAKYANEYIDLQIKTYMAMIEVYKAEVQANEIMVRGELAKVEVYKSQIEAQKLIGEVNTQTIQAYSEKIRAASLLVERYKSEIQAMVSLVEVEKAKIEANKTQFDAWATKQNVLISRFNGQVQLFKSQSDVNVAAAGVKVSQAEYAIRAGIASAELSVKSYEVSERSMNLKANMAMEAARGVAQASASLAAGAMAAMSAHASMDYRETKDVTND